jgi:hypothetical protein
MFHPQHGAPTEAETDAAVRGELGQVTEDLDAAFAERIARTERGGEIDPAVDALERGRLASAVLHSLSVRARGGEPRAALEELARTGVELLLS